MPNVKFIRDTLYTMKKDYGVAIRYGRLLSQVIDPDTGLMLTTKEVYSIRKAIELPSKLARKFVQDIAYLAANKNFTYGALFDEKTSVFIIDKRDLPKNLVLNMDDFIFLKHQRFTIKEAEILEHDLGWLLTVHLHEGANPFDQIPDRVRQHMTLQQEVLYVLN